MFDMDAAATRWINSWAGIHGFTDAAAIWLSALGVPLMVLAVASQWWRRADRQRVRHVAVAAGLTFLLALAVNQAIIQFIHRLRPYDAGVTHLWIPRAIDWSFPSDHATASFAIAFAVLAQGFRRAGGWLTLAAAVTALSRVYLGTHYVTDALGGALTAAMIVHLSYREGTWFDRTVTGIL